MHSYIGTDLGDCDFVVGTLEDFLHWAESTASDRYIVGACCYM